MVLETSYADLIYLSASGDDESFGPARAMAAQRRWPEGLSNKVIGPLLSACFGHPSQQEHKLGLK